MLPCDRFIFAQLIGAVSSVLANRKVNFHLMKRICNCSVCNECKLCVWGKIFEPTSGNTPKWIVEIQVPKHGQTWISFLTSWIPSWLTWLSGVLSRTGVWNSLCLPGELVSFIGQGYKLTGMFLSTSLTFYFAIALHLRKDITEISLGLFLMNFLIKKK